MQAAVQVFDGALTEIRGAQTVTPAAVVGSITLADPTGGGAAITAAAALIHLPRNATWLGLTPWGFASSAECLRFAFTPWLWTVLTFDGMLTQQVPPTEDVDAELQDGDTTVGLTLNSMPTLANGGSLFVGSHMPFRGFRIDAGNKNSTAATILCEYWDGSAWVDLSATDGTASGGVVLAQDGDVTFTVPAAWAKTKLNDRYPNVQNRVAQHFREDLYWVRVSVSTALDATVQILGLSALARSTAYSELLSGQTYSQVIARGPDATRTGIQLGKVGQYGVAAVEALTDTGTARLIVNCGTLPPEVF